MSALGQDRPNPDVRVMSAVAPIASTIATTAMIRWDRIPSDVGNAFNFDQTGSRPKLR
jgi:hypothetical protein